MLIDDDEDDYVILHDLFSEIRRNKYEVIWKASYQEGLSALRNESFDACLLDYRLGEKTGLDLLREAHKYTARCPIILLTGQSDFELDLQAMQIGAADYLVKTQLTAPLLERSVRYSMKHALDMEELRENKAQLLQKDRLASLGLLASSLAHEIGTPLGIIRSRAELAEKKLSQENAVKNDMGVIVVQIDRITKLVNSLLHLARGQQSDLAGEVSLKQVFQDVLNLVRHELVRKNIILKTKFDIDQLVKAESGPLAQVFLNLLVNSVHAIEEARKAGRNDQHYIKIEVLKKNSFVEVSIYDSGSGISDENMSQLFKPFFTTKDIGQGTGLGLATSYKLVHSWGGAISVESQEDHGTKFTVSLLKA